MANHKSAKKRIRTTARKTEINSAYMSMVRTSVKKLKLAASNGSTAEELAPLFVQAQAKLSKAVTKGILHKNNASRRVARLAALVKRSVASS